MKSQHLPSRRLFIGSLPYRFSEGELLSLFVPQGKVVAVKIIHNQWGRSRGMGYVEFEQLEDAVQAKEKLHGYPIGDLKIIVDFAEPDPFMTPEGKARHQEAVARKPKRFNKDNFLPHPDSDSDDYQKAKKSSFRRTNSQEPSSETTRLRFKPKKKARQSIFDSRNFGSHIGAKFASRNKKKKRR